MPGPLGGKKKRQGDEETVMSEPNGPPCGETLGDYRILARLDAGPARKIYKAEHTGRSSICEIEIVSGSRKRRDPICARLMREIQLLSRIYHPNLMSFRDVTMLPDCTCIVETECLEGETLRERLQRAGRLGVHDAVPVLTGAAEGLAEAHSHGVLHRALSPDCVSLVPETTGGPERVVLTRFGLGQPTSGSEFAALGPELVAARLTGYSAPEQRGTLTEGESLDGRTDIYSLAVIAYEMITGRLPGEGGASEAPGARAPGDPVTTRNAVSGLFIPPELDALLARSLAKDRSQRPSSIDVFLRELKKF
jgi:serine/threonine protein kinase